METRGAGGAFDAAALDGLGRGVRLLEGERDTLRLPVRDDVPVEERVAVRDGDELGEGDLVCVAVPLGVYEPLTEELTDRETLTEVLTD